MNITPRSLAVLPIAILAIALLNHDSRSQLPKPAEPIKYAEVRFVLAGDAGENTIFRKRLVSFAEAKQIRHGPVGVGGGLLGEATYIVAIVGDCDGAIDDIAFATENAASNLPGQAVLVASYRSTAKCLQKEKELR